MKKEKEKFLKNLNLDNINYLLFFKKLKKVIMSSRSNSSEPKESRRIYVTGFS